MFKKNIFIINSKSLYDIFDEVKALLNFNVFKFNEKDFILNEHFKEPNLVFLSYSLKDTNSFTV